MPSLPVCVDASVVVAIVTPEEQHALAVALWQSWLREERVILAPRLFTYEVTSALRRKTVRGMLTLEEARNALRAALDLKISLLDPAGLSERAFELAERLHRPAAYDAHYLALADHLRCAFWTGDERLYNAVRDHFPRILWLGEYHVTE